PRAVVPQQAYNRQFIACRGLHVPSADAEATVTADDDDLLSGPRELRADAHPYAVADGSERASIDHLTHEAASECAAHPSGESEAVDDGGGVLVEHLDEIVTQARRMQRHVRDSFLVLLGDLRIEAGTGRCDFLVPLGVAIPAEIELQLLDAIDHLTQH